MTGQVTITDKSAQTQNLSGLNKDASKALTVTKNDQTSFQVYVSTNSIEELNQSFAGIIKSGQALADQIPGLLDAVDGLFTRTESQPSAQNLKAQVASAISSSSANSIAGRALVGQSKEIVFYLSGKTEKQFMDIIAAAVRCFVWPHRHEFQDDSQILRIVY